MGDVKDVIGLLPEAYFDLIGRMVPGTIATLVFLTGYPDIAKHIKGVEPFFGPIGLAVVLLLVAYAIGLILDTAGDVISESVIWTANKTNLVKLRTGDELFDCVKAHQPDYYPIFLKMVAESVALRSLLLLVALTIFMPASVSMALPLSPKIVIMLLLLLALLRIQRTVRKRVS